MSEQRRDNILVTMNKSKAPITGSKLAKKFNVSRQVVVQDIAILRAAGFDIIATPRGYMMPGASQPRPSCVMAVKHNHAQIGDELMSIVDLGGKVLDVIIEHPIYGEYKGSLQLSSPSDVRAYMKVMDKNDAEPLSALTEGIHLHTVEADTIEILDAIEKVLMDKGYLLK
ncbi:MAG TPA: transcription repressor NadR [Bacillota bacterium]|nr:transcription repressor NadR [Bacillota bacterium]